MGKQRVLSGVQPTGNLHLGNYLGAIRTWVDMQDNYDNFFCVVDLHAITVPHNPKTLAQDTYTIAALYLACGIDLDHATIFVQSHVTAHSELAWLLNCITPLNWLERMIQFKEKAVKQGENVGVGLLDYPVLMAADILLYHADKVPVGDDQKQHLELTRDIAHKFNTDYSHEYFKLPDPIINKDAPRIMSLRDANNKMSKSDVSKYSRFLLTDSNDEISTKISKAKSDSLKMPSSSDELSDRPEINNLITIYSSISNIDKDSVINLFSDKEISFFKSELKDIVINLVEPIASSINEIKSDISYLKTTLEDGASRATERASKTIGEVNKLMGFSID